MNTEIAYVNNLKFKIRPNTTDHKVIEEVIIRRAYRKPKINFDVEKDEVWLDLGGNIGTFSVYALNKGAKVITYEPEPDNIQLLNDNLKLNNFTNCQVIPKGVNTTGGTTKLYLCKGTYNKYRHTVYEKRGRTAIQIETTKIDDAITPDVTAIKMDIEGSEVPILEHIKDWKNVNKLVFEYSFDIFPSVDRFRKMLKKLARHFDIIHAPNIPADVKEYKFWPAAVLVYCKRTKPTLGRYYESDDTWTIYKDSTTVQHNGKTLAVFIKNAITDPELIKAGRNLKTYAQPTTLRGKAAGKGNSVKSSIVGYMDKSHFHPCRQTAMYRKHADLFDNETVKLVKHISNLFKTHCPDEYNRQKAFVDSLNQNMVIQDTCYTTLTVNQDFRTRSHLDSGDFKDSLGNLFVFNYDDFTGGEFLLPEHKIAFHIKEGDALFVDVHQVHCNNPIINKGRISLVLYAREGIKNCPYSIA